MAIKAASEILRDYITDGVPASGAHRPVKSDLRNLMRVLDRYMLLEQFGGAVGASGAVNKAAWDELITYSDANPGRTLFLLGNYAFNAPLGTIEHTLVIEGHSLSACALTADYNAADPANDAFLEFLGGAANGCSLTNLSLAPGTGRALGTMVRIRSTTQSLASGTATITIASPGVITWVAHGLAVNDSVKFTTTGALPTGIVAGTTYYVHTTPTANTFTIGADVVAVGDPAINTSGTQSGTHTASKLGSDAASYTMLDRVNITYGPGSYRKALHLAGLGNDFFGGQGVRGIVVRDSFFFAHPSYDETVLVENTVGLTWTGGDIFGSAKFSGGEALARRSVFNHVANLKISNDVTVENHGGIYFTGVSCTNLIVGTDATGHFSGNIDGTATIDPDSEDTFTIVAGSEATTAPANLTVDHGAVATYTLLKTDFGLHGTNKTHRFTRNGTVVVTLSTVATYGFEAHAYITIINDATGTLTIDGGAGSFAIDNADTYVLQPGGRVTIVTNGSFYNTITPPLTSAATAGEVAAGTINTKTVTPKNLADAKAPVALTDTTTITTNCALSDSGVFTVTLGGNRNMGQPSSAIPGRDIEYHITQDATGSRTISWNGGFKFPGGVAPTLSTAAGSVDVVIFRVISSTIFRFKSMSKGMS
jgi:hypothetical protein